MGLEEHNGANVRLEAAKQVLDRIGLLKGKDRCQCKSRTLNFILPQE